MPETPKLLPRAISETKANMRLVRQAKNDYHLTVDGTTEPEDLLEPGWWKHIAHLFARDWKNVKSGQEPPDLLVVCEDRTWRQSFEVRDVGPYHVKVLPISDVWRYGLNPREVEPEATDECDYRVWYTPGAKWMVQRLRDKENLVKGLLNRDVGDAWLVDYLEKLDNRAA